MRTVSTDYFHKVDLDNARRDAERLSQYRANPEAWLARRVLAGLPAVPPRGAEGIQVRGRANRVEPAPEPAEPEMHELPGYRLHLAKDAIVDAFLELRAERQRSRPNTDERDAIKAEYGGIFADVGIRLVKIPNWARHERAIMEPRLR